MSQQAVPLLSTKLTVVRPARDIVRRIRLEQLLDAIPHHRLTLIAAGAGFGKTTQLVSWLAATRTSTAWLSLDSDDNNLLRFLAYLIGALRTIDPKVGRGLEHTLQSVPIPPVLSLLTPLVNELSELDGEHVLVLEDYHVIENEAIHQSVHFLIEHLPPAIRLVIVTRVDPPIPLSRMRVRSELLEIRASDLQFTSQEAAEFLSQRMGLELNDEQIATLTQRTEGWPAGLQMAALSLQGSDDIDQRITSFTGLDRFVLDFLLEEVLASLPQEQQQAMLALSILPRFNGALCEAMTDCVNGSELLEQLEHANLFVLPLDNRRTWYRYHQLFSDLLLHRLRVDMPERLPQLHLRAARWFASHNSIADALDHAQAANDLELHREILEANWRRVISSSPVENTRRHLASLPDTAIESSVRLLVVQCFNLCVIGKVMEAQRLVDLAEPMVADLKNDPDQRELTGQLSVVRSFVAINIGDADTAILHAERALKLVAEYPPNSPLFVWNSSRPVLNSIIGVGYELRGEFVRAESIFRSISDAVRVSGDLHSLFASLANESRASIHLGRFARLKETAGEMLAIIDEGLTVLEPDARSFPHQQLGIYHEERLESETAAQHIRAALDSTPHYMVDRIIELQKGLFDLCMTQGNIDEAQRVVVLMESLSLDGHDPRLERTVRLTRAKLLLSQGNITGARAMFRPDQRVMTPVEIFMYARILLAAGEVQESVDQISRVREGLRKGNAPFIPYLYTLVLHAAALGCAGRSDEALDTLLHAITLASPERILRPFANDAVYIAPLLVRVLKERRSSGIPQEYMKALCNVCGVPLESIVVNTGGIVSVQVAGTELTVRELEILQLMSLGYTNRKIADKLYVSINTVKTHASNLFEKLGATSRVDALVRARESRLLES